MQTWSDYDSSQYLNDGDRVVYCNITVQHKTSREQYRHTFDYVVETIMNCQSTAKGVFRLSHVMIVYKEFGVSLIGSWLRVGGSGIDRS